MLGADTDVTPHQTTALRHFDAKRQARLAHQFEPRKAGQTPVA